MNGSWGGLPIAAADRILERDWRFETLPKLSPTDSVLPYGLGRSYGDSCINSHATQISTRRLNRLIRFDAQQGLLQCEAGITLDEILQVVVPHGWFLPVLPGTRFVTLGGAIANDVHGKNHHHAGSFGCHVQSLTLLRSDGERYRCTPQENAALFAATIGGLGLTGLLVSAEVKLVPVSSDQMEVEDLAFSSVEEFGQLSRDSTEWEYNVSWIDTFARNGQVGRGIFSRARHAHNSGTLKPGRRPRIAVPITPPVSLINKWTVDVFNRAYFARRKQNKGLQYTHYQPYFFPLDGIANWNRIYGRKGFYQYQCVVPRVGGEAVIEALLREVNRSGAASFLTVLKEFGEQRSPGMLSFPRSGLTLAIDFPNRGERTRNLLASFDEIVQSAGGALYPAKDARMPATLFTSGFPRLQEFVSEIDPKFSSTFWRRIQQ
ncbi:Decaprenylphosphoryl-beta-D-ribose oxidase [Halioglobus japonicus]|nr:Decaprenylphosphoryl-beta-D-ribose oxidase [Halioglobus japonicus]